ncbi:hypothetical protein FNF29_00098 [Cafeteria roenbergensis]|uniref:C2 domain-containing protein n=1 Tax=Cafeteria roenbergensis TaxID=33653 RepID=A0A5A8CKL8_CAFRO|nr:hypothetical protein FNF28_06956 [Cafeteria roenbergensis]KAA0157522.1 hypothetical protein FNF29_00098 [Cafeteria roenbergensis]KAA0162187.1 hypothetical protein FNF31_03422 [Cafeteria roenbergensis]|eukprot:KAA0157522.1 hypothetical protein FNF29_00098 [Cafeteria roenbergensis]
MPSVIKVLVRSAQNLPCTTQRPGGPDSYAVLTFGEEQQKSAVACGSRAPTYDFSTRFEVDDDRHLVSTPLSLTIIQRDRVAADDVIGTVVLSLEPLLSHSTSLDSEIDGWLPLHDTLLGLRGEVCMQVRVSHGAGGDAGSSRMRGAMMGLAAEREDEVQFYAVSRLTHRVYPQQWICGEVEELLVEADPEYNALQDTFRSSRRSNAARLALLYKLSFKLREAVARKTIRLGANAVLAYQQHFDVEGDSGIVARAYGTAVHLVSRTALMGEIQREATEMHNSAALGAGEQGTLVAPDFSAWHRHDMGNSARQQGPRSSVHF